MNKEETYVVYALRSEKYQRIYVGMTNNLVRRIHEHNSGHSKSTKAYRPWVLIYKEECSDRQQARLREKYWKSGVGKQQLKLL